MAASKLSQPFNNWVKCSEGLNECGKDAAKIVKHEMETWHTTDIKSKAKDFKCAGSATCKPTLKKGGTLNRPKKGRGYCDQCVKLADELETNILAKCTVPGKSSYEVQWKHAESSDWYEHVVEVAKLFGLQNIKADSLAAMKNFDDFDPAWLLSIMEKVNLFHKKDINVQSQVSIFVKRNKRL